MLNNLTADDAEDAENQGISASSALSAVKWSRRSMALHRDPAWHALNLYGEHTWGLSWLCYSPRLYGDAWREARSQGKYAACERSWVSAPTHRLHSKPPS